MGSRTRVPLGGKEIWKTAVKCLVLHLHQSLFPDPNLRVIWQQKTAASAQMPKPISSWKSAVSQPSTGSKITLHKCCLTGSRHRHPCHFLKVSYSWNFLLGNRKGQVLSHTEFLPRTSYGPQRGPRFTSFSHDDFIQGGRPGDLLLKDSVPGPSTHTGFCKASYFYNNTTSPYLTLCVALMFLVTRFRAQAIG